MARAFTEKEKEQVAVALKQAAEACLMAYGVRKTTVDELVQRANISKGSFYAFYPSKEVLFLTYLTIIMIKLNVLS